ncbi:hypothetical protein N7492_002576 [Penicillium capsulatum]|uniref:Uncharacterized protein n=1 Tax=Penicillium capsulatum TaxID=69766 RepID=A0A9W9LVB9_9EURO|nr:hypothetical protein N7492_002576 [Penicillium capsulatum]
MAHWGHYGRFRLLDCAVALAQDVIVRAGAVFDEDMWTDARAVHEKQASMLVFRRENQGH